MRLIDADIDVNDYVETWDCNCITGGIQTVMAVDDLSYLPTVDAVPVVRCRDCKYRTWFAPYYGCGNFESPFYAAVDGDVAIMTKPDDFCSYGEKMDGEAQ